MGRARAAAGSCSASAYAHQRPEVHLRPAAVSSMRTSKLSSGSFSAVSGGCLALAWLVTSLGCALNPCLDDGIPSGDCLNPSADSQSTGEDGESGSDSADGEGGGDGSGGSGGSGASAGSAGDADGDGGDGQSDAGGNDAGAEGNDSADGSDGGDAGDAGSTTGADGGEGGDAGGQFCRDADSDGFGDPNDCVDEATDGYVENDDDCDDSSSVTRPGDGSGNREVDDPAVCMKDEDGDGFGDLDPPAGVDPGSDCDDTSATTHVGASERELSDQCTSDADDDGWADEFPDPDGDFPGIVPGTDCDDDDDTVQPGDGVGTREVDRAGVCMKDEDGDGFGDADPDGPGDDIDPGTDCNDDDESAFPGSAEKENDGDTRCMKDEDDDGWGDNDPDGDVDPGLDCDDGQVDVNPDPGCLDPLTLDVEHFTVDLNADQRMDTLAAGGSGSFDWTWSPATFLNATTVAEPMARSITASQSYEVTVSDRSTGESVTKTVTLHVRDQPMDWSRCFDPAGDASNTGQWAVGGDMLSPFDPGNTNGFFPAQWTTPAAGEDETSICQETNNEPSAVVCDHLVMRNARVSASFQAGTMDFDWIGFAWGIQPRADGTYSQYYLFSWKGEAQFGHWRCPENFGPAFNEGMQITRIDETALADMESLSCGQLMGVDTTSAEIAKSLARPADFDVVQGNDIAAAGWNPGERYTLTVEHRTTGSLVRIASENGMDVVEVDIGDDTYADGRFAAFSFSQESSCFRNLRSETLP